MKHGGYMSKLYVLVIALGFLTLLTSCRINEASSSETSCQVEQLLLQETDYPANTVFEKIQSQLYGEPKESVAQTAYYYNSWMSESAIRYASRQRAAEIFDKYEKVIFAPSEVIGSWETPSIFPDEDSLVFENYEIACGNVVSFGNRCYMIGQYEKYYVFFRADIFNDGITHEMFRDLVLKIDERMSDCVLQ
jgi:hypothetical protein